MPKKAAELTANSAPEDFEAVLSEPENLRDLVNGGNFSRFVQDYTTAKANKYTDIEAKVKDEVQAGLADFLKDNGQVARPNQAQLDRLSAGTRRNAVYNHKAPGAQLDRQFDDPAEFFQAVWHQVEQLADSENLTAKAAQVKKIQNSFGSQVPADGGFLIPEELRSDLLQLSLENSVVRPKARTIPMSSLAVPIPIVDDTSHVDSVFGGITAFWTEEGASMQESQASFGRARLEAKKLTIYTEAPNELVADAPAFGAFLNSALPQAMAFYEDKAFLSGSGVGEPLGALNSAARVSVEREVGDMITFTDIINMYARILPQSMGSGVWLASPAAVPQLLKLVNDTAGTEPVSPSLWLTGGQAINAPTMTLLGRPLIISEKVPNLGDSGDLSFVDFGFYLIGDRQVAQVTSSPHFKFRTDETAYKVVERVDGRPWLNSAITPANGGDSLSPIVTLNSAVEGS